MDEKEDGRSNLKRFDDVQIVEFVPVSFAVNFYNRLSVLILLKDCETCGGKDSEEDQNDRETVQVGRSG